MELGADLESTKGTFARTKAQELQEEEGASVTCALHLPGGSVDKMSFAAGVTVAYVKVR